MHTDPPPPPEGALRDELRGVTRAFQQALHSLPLDTRLVDVARLALPDACARLDHVVALTESAAHTTLDKVDALRGSLDASGRIAASLPEHTRGRLEALIREQRGHCAELDAAQAYQDLTGQIIRRVTQIIRGLEADLLALAEGARWRRARPRWICRAAAVRPSPSLTAPRRRRVMPMTCLMPWDCDR